MNKILTFVVIVFSLFILPSVIFAQGNQNGRENEQGIEISDEEVELVTQENGVLNQNKIKTKNQGEETHLQVATQEMEQLMDMDGLSEEVGSKVRTIAQEQVNTQAQTEIQVNKLESKSKLMKKLFGPDYGAIKNLKQQMEQNQLRIQQLVKLQVLVTNQADQTQLEEAIQALIEQNTALADQIATEEQTSSLLGWLVKFFVK